MLMNWAGPWLGGMAPVGKKVVLDRGIFVGVGVDVHPDAERRLEHAVADVEAVRGVLGEDFDGDVLANPTEAEVRAHLKDLPELPSGGRMLAIWSGHGIPAALPGDVGLLTADSGLGPGDGLPSTDFVRKCAARGSCGDAGNTATAGPDCSTATRT
jgi:hypothetical protein